MAKIMASVLIMVGRRETWEGSGEGARMTPGQLIAGAVIGGIIVIGVLLAIVATVIALAGART